MDEQAASRTQQGPRLGPGAPDARKSGAKDHARRRDGDQRLREFVANRCAAAIGEFLQRQRPRCRTRSARVGALVCAAALTAAVSVSAALGADASAAGATGTRASSSGRFVTVAGGGFRPCDSQLPPAAGGALATLTPFCAIQDVVALPDGSFLVSDTGAYGFSPVESFVARIFPDGTIRTVAGTGTEGFSGDGGPATSAQLNGPEGLAALPDGGFLIAYTMNHRIRRVWPDGTITTVAGNGDSGSPDDGGPALDAYLGFPDRVAALPDGGFLVSNGFSVREVHPDGTITTVAADGDPLDRPGDGGPATRAGFGAEDIAVERDGSVLIADLKHSSVRKVTADGIIRTVARVPDPGPQSLEPLPDGGFLVAAGLDGLERGQVLRVSKRGTVSVVAGARGKWRDNWVEFFAPLEAFLMPEAVALRPDGTLLVADQQKVYALQKPGNGVIGLALRGGSERVTPTRYSAEWRTSAPAKIKLEVFAGRRRVASSELRARSAGVFRLGVRARFRPRVYGIIATATSAGHATAAPAARLLSRTLPMRLALRIFRAEARRREIARSGSHARLADGSTSFDVGRCRRASRGRIDCISLEDEGGGWFCGSVDVLAVGGGSVRWGSYRCGGRRDPFRHRRHVRWGRLADLTPFR